MAKQFLMGIDIGTSGCKIALFDYEGKVISNITKEYKTYYPSSGFVEQDVNKWWEAVCAGIREVIKSSLIEPKEIAAIGIDGQSWTCLPIDKEGNALCNAMIWLDRRSVKQASYIKQVCKEESLINLSGNPIDAAYITPKILWFKENKPDIYINTYKFLQSNAYIGYKLTGEFSQDYSQGYGFHFFNISKGCWDEKIAEKLGISLNLMPKLYHCHEVIGTVTSKAAQETGLKKGIPVVAGGLDAACCTLGAGVIKPGQTQEQGGQAGGMSIQVDKPLIHPKLILSYHVLPNQWLLQGGSVGGSAALKWFNDELGEYEKNAAKKYGISSYAVMDKEAEKIRAGSEGLIFLPYMAGERSPIWNSKARGVFFGLSYNKGRPNMIRAVMEGVAFSLMHNLETACQVGADVSTLISVGGAANSKIWTQIKSDTTGKPIKVPYSDNASALGAAILAGVGTGVYKNFDEAVNATVQIKHSYFPNGKLHDVYKNYYKLYLKLYKNLEESYDVLDTIK